MPIISDVVEIVHKALPITLNADGSAAVTLTTGYLAGEEFKPIAARVIALVAEDVNKIMQANAVEGLSRHDDLSKAVYELLIDKGIVSGTIA